MFLYYDVLFGVNYTFFEIFMCCLCDVSYFFSIVFICFYHVLMLNI